MITKLSYRKIQSYLAMLTVFVLLASFYLQYGFGLQPCPLCLMQRFCVIALLGIMGLSLGTIKKAHWVSFFQIFIACAGLYFALRQVWLQSLPPGATPACMPGLNILVHYFPWQTILKALFLGGGDCAEISWSFMGWSLAAWSAVYFIFMITVGVYLFIRTRNSVS